MRYGLPDEHIKIILDYIARHSEIEEETTRVFGSNKRCRRNDSSYLGAYESLTHV